jgi:hypothetical protein
MHSAERIVAEWQPIVVGDVVKLHPDVALVVAVVEPGRAYGYSRWWAGLIVEPAELISFVMSRRMLRDEGASGATWSSPAVALRQLTAGRNRRLCGRVD